MEIIIKMPLESEKELIFKSLNNYNKKLYGDKLDYKDSYFWTKRMLKSIYDPKNDNKFAGLYQDGKLSIVSTFVSKDDFIKVHEIVPVDLDFYNNNEQAIIEEFILFFLKKLESEEKNDFLIEVDKKDHGFINLLEDLGFFQDSKDSYKNDIVTTIYKKSMGRKKGRVRR